MGVGQAVCTPGDSLRPSSEGVVEPCVDHTPIEGAPVGSLTAVCDIICCPWSCFEGPAQPDDCPHVDKEVGGVFWECRRQNCYHHSEAFCPHLDVQTETSPSWTGNMRPLPLLPFARTLAVSHGLKYIPLQQCGSATSVARWLAPAARRGSSVVAPPLV